jgi:pimeloyl-ACP methyl ester carboxylesterase
MVRRYLNGALLAAAATLLTGSGQIDLQAQLRETAASYLAGIAAVAPITGRDTAFDYYERLRDDADLLDDRTAGRGYTTAQWLEMVRRFGMLDLSLATQLLERRYVSMGDVRGWGETMVRSSRDGTMQPVAIYVPPAYAPGRPVSLIVFLHGRLQPETHLLAPFYMAQLANATSTIVVAPWGRGYYDFRGAESDVYDALDAATTAFSVHPRKRYLAGYSMGAFSVFEIAPIHPDRWSAVMCIAGALWGEDARRLVGKMRTSRFYVLTGSADDDVPTQWPTSTANYLASTGIDVSYYSQREGTHRVVTLLPILTLAWNDMLHDVVRSPPPTFGLAQLPSEIPPSGYKP